MEQKNVDDLTQLTDEELATRNQELMAERAVVEIRVKADQMLLQAEMNKRASEARVEKTLESLTDEDKAILARRLNEPKALAPEEVTPTNG